MTAPTPNAEHLAGPWVAILNDCDGFVYESVADARENAEDPDGDYFEISVRRGTAAAVRPAGDRARLPGSFQSGDRAYELDDVWLDDPHDPSVGAEARFAQAQAMAAGLNAAGAAAAPPVDEDTMDLATRAVATDLRPDADRGEPEWDACGAALSANCFNGVSGCRVHP